MPSTLKLRLRPPNKPPLTVSLPDTTIVGDIPSIADLPEQNQYLILDPQRKELAQNLSLKGQVESGDVLTIQPANMAGTQKMSTAAPPKKMQNSNNTKNSSSLATMIAGVNDGPAKKKSKKAGSGAGKLLKEYSAGSDMQGGFGGALAEMAAGGGGSAGRNFRGAMKSDVEVLKDENEAHYRVTCVDF